MVLVDDQVLFTGSNNFSAAGFVTNEENSVVMRAPDHSDRIAAFICDFDAIFSAGVQKDQMPLDDSDPIRQAALDAIEQCNGADVWFPPSGERQGKPLALQAVLDAINSSKTSIDLAPDLLANPTLVKAMLAHARAAQAAGRSFRIRAALDASAEAFGNPAFGECLSAGASEGLDIEVKYWPGDRDIFQLLHHKFMIVDGQVVMNGSANYSSKALAQSFENVTRYAGPAFADVVAAFGARFERVFADSLTTADLKAQKNLDAPPCPLN
jgi:phosphatidylserine/phosphatidylglycerophosphate/cardiolipin synthase-like enzyme